MTYQGNNPKRRIAKPGLYTVAELDELAAGVRYVGSAHHKLHPSDYDLDPPAAPRAIKSLCDDVRHVRRAEAQALLQAGIRRGMVSPHSKGEWPKYVWAVDDTDEVYEALRGDNRPRYHGYRLKKDDVMRKWVLKEWNKR